MRIYTSNFNHLDMILSNNFLPVAICQHPPKDFKYPVLKLLAPPQEIREDYHKTGDWKKFTTEFNSYLINRNVCEYVDALKKISEENNNPNIVLLCYEDPKQNCHRHIVSKFFNDFGILGGNVHELSPNDFSLSSIELF